MGCEEVVELAFGALHSLKGAKALQVGTSHIGDESAGGFHVVHEFSDVTGMRGAHFHHCDLMLRAEGEQRARHTHIIVVVGLSVHHVVLLGQYGRNQFLGGRLAICSRNADDGEGELPAVLPCQFLIGGQRVIDQDIPAVALGNIFLFIHHGIGTTFLQGIGGKLVSIK